MTITLTRDEAQQVLDALDSKHDMTKAEWRVLQYRAFTAVRAALAQPEQEPVAYDINGATVYIKPPVYGAAPQQPEPPCKTGSQCVGGKCERCAVQEPWGYISHRSWKMPVFVEAGDLEVSGLPFNNPDYTPVYKAPPQREFIGLTDEEIIVVTAPIDNRKGGWVLDLSRAIEAKLREKNA